MAALTQQPPAGGCTDARAVYPLTGYYAAARLICAQESEETRNDFYAELCSRRNRGIGQVLAIGDRTAPEACAVCSGPVPCPVPVQEKMPTGLWQRLCARMKKPQPPELLPTVYLSDVFVAPQYRSGGRGAALVRAALQRLALPEDTRQIAVYCAPEMIPFYEKLQLRTGGRLRRWTLRENPGEENLTRKK
jgi:GNAT superfamily N-acetyltransferase